MTSTAPKFKKIIIEVSLDSQRIILVAYFYEIIHNSSFFCSPGIDSCRSARMPMTSSKHSSRPPWTGWRRPRTKWIAFPLSPSNQRPSGTSKTPSRLVVSLRFIIIQCVPPKRKLISSGKLLSVYLIRKSILSSFMWPQKYDGLVMDDQAEAIQIHSVRIMFDLNR